MWLGCHGIASRRAPGLLCGASLNFRKIPSSKKLVKTPPSFISPGQKKIREIARDRRKRIGKIKEKWARRRRARGKNGGIQRTGGAPRRKMKEKGGNSARRKRAPKKIRQKWAKSRKLEFFVFWGCRRLGPDRRLRSCFPKI